MTTRPTDLIEELRWRGLLHQCTDETGLREHLATGQRRIYTGFDPTAPSLTIGNLVPIMMLAHVRRAGHIPVVVMGGGTGLIGDPSGKSAERTLMTYETVQDHVRAQRPIFDAVLGSVQGPDYAVRNNADWLMKISYLEALRDIGKFFSVNMMMQKDSVKARLESREQGISYTEFSYMILQAYDFAHLYEAEGVTAQFGGSDQFGNIVAGTDLIRRKRAVVIFAAQEDLIRLADLAGLAPDIETPPLDVSEGLKQGQRHLPDEFGLNELAAKCHRIVKAHLEHWKKQEQGRLPEGLVETFERHSANLDWAVQGDTRGLTAPLVTKADGGKFGKTETGAVWLTADRTSPYAYYQFWLNASDADAANWIKIYTFLGKDEIDAIVARHAENPGARELQRTLAQHATRILHGDAAMQGAEAAAKALFSGDVATLDERTLREVLADVPSSERDRADLGPDGLDAVDLLIACKLAASKREAREFIANGSVTVNGQKLGEGERVTGAHLLHGSLTAIRRGKKNWHLIRWA